MTEIKKLGQVNTGLDNKELNLLRAELVVVVREVLYQEEQKKKTLEGYNLRSKALARDLGAVLKKIDELQDPNYMPLFKQPAEGEVEDKSK